MTDTNGTASPKHDVLFGYLHPNDVASSFHKGFVNLLGYDLSGAGRLGQIADVRCGSMGIPEGRNDLCRTLLKSECDWLWMVDSDMGFEPNVLDQLLSIADPVERPIIGGLCFANRETVPDQMNGFRTFPRPTLLNWVTEEEGGRFQGRSHYPVNTLVRVGATGAAMLLIHRSVIQRILDEFGETWFDRTPDFTGAMQGEDISFFCRTNALDIPAYVHTGIRTTHMKWIWLAESDFWTSFLAPPATERVDVIVPVLHRPQNVEPLMTSLRASTGLATAWFVCDEDDDEEIGAALNNGAEVLIVPGERDHPGTFAEKVNIAYERIPDFGEPAPWLLLVGDDVRFRPGWLDAALDVARRYDSSVVGTNDLCNPRVMKGEHATHPMIRRSYIDELGASWDGPGVVCHEGYRHWFVDDEIVLAAKLRDTFQMALASQVEHMHPFADRAPFDDVYAAGARHADRDKSLWQRRLRAYAMTQLEERPQMPVAEGPKVQLQPV